MLRGSPIRCLSAEMVTETQSRAVSVRSLQVRGGRIRGLLPACVQVPVCAAGAEACSIGHEDQFSRGGQESS